MKNFLLLFMTLVALSSCQQQPLITPTASGKVYLSIALQPSLINGAWETQQIFRDSSREGYGYGPYTGAWLDIVPIVGHHTLIGTNNVITYWPFPTPATLHNDTILTYSSTTWVPGMLNDPVYRFVVDSCYALNGDTTMWVRQFYIPIVQANPNGGLDTAGHGDPVMLEYLKQ